MGAVIVHLGAAAASTPATAVLAALHDAAIVVVRRGVGKVGQDVKGVQIQVECRIVVKEMVVAAAKIGLRTDHLINIEPLVLSVVATAAAVVGLDLLVTGERNVGGECAVQVVLRQVQEGHVRLALQVAKCGLEVQQAARTVVRLGLDAAVLGLLGLGAREETVRDRLHPGIGRGVKLRPVQMVQTKILDVVERVDGGGNAAQVPAGGGR